MKIDAFEIEDDVEVTNRNVANEREPVIAVEAATPVPTSRTRARSSRRVDRTEEQKRGIACGAGLCLTLIVACWTAVLTASGWVLLTQYGCRDCYAPTVTTRNSTTTTETSCTVCNVPVAELRFNGGGPFAMTFSSRIYVDDATHVDLVWPYTARNDTCDTPRDRPDFCDEGNGGFHMPDDLNDYAFHLSAPLVLASIAVVASVSYAVLPIASPRRRRAVVVTACTASTFAFVWYVFAVFMVLYYKRLAEWHDKGGPFPELVNGTIVVFTDRKLDVNFGYVIWTCGTCAVLGAFAQTIHHDVL